MNLSSLPELLLAWVKTQGTALLQGNRTEQASPFKVGAEYEGKVLDQLPSGRFLVQVASQKLDMGLPRNSQAGDTVRLTFLSSGPRPTFLLNQSQATPVQQVQISSTAQQVSALARIGQTVAQTSVQSPVPSAAQAAAQSPAQVSARPTASAPVVSAAKAAATAVAGRASPTPSPPNGSLKPQAAAAPAAATPQVRATAASTTTRVAALSQPAQGQQMGATAAAGQLAAARPIVANVVILQGYTEASAAAPPAVASATTALQGQLVEGLRATVPSSTTLNPTVLAEVSEPSRNLLPTRLAQAMQESGLFYESHLARWSKGNYPFDAILNEPQARLARDGVNLQGVAQLGGMPEEAARIAGRQLHVLEGGAILWQGFVWPGQWMDWLVEERQGGQEGGQAEGEGASQWSTELRLALPRMGSVHAQLSLRGHDVTLRLHAGATTTAQTLRMALPELQGGLQAAGLQPVNMAVVAAGEGA